MGDSAGGDMLRKCLIQRYTDQPKKFTLKQFIDVLVNFNTNNSLTDLLSSASNSAMECLESRDQLPGKPESNDASYHKLKAIEYRVTSIVNEFHNQEGEIQKKMFEQCELQHSLQSKATKVRIECDKSLSDFTQQLTKYQQKSSELNEKLRDVENELRNDFQKVSDNQSVGGITKVQQRIAQDINKTQNDIKQQAELLKSFQCQMTIVETDELKTQMTTTTSLIDSFSETEIYFQELHKDFRSKYKSTSEPPHSFILLIGGQRKLNQKSVQLDTLEIYAPYNPSFNRILDCRLKIGRYENISALLSDQQIYVVGGFGQEKDLNSMEIFDPFLQIRVSDGPLMSVNRSNCCYTTGTITCLWRERR